MPSNASTSPDLEIVREEPPEDPVQDSDLEDDDGADELERANESWTSEIDEENGRLEEEPFIRTSEMFPSYPRKSVLGKRAKVYAAKKAAEELSKDKKKRGKHERWSLALKAGILTQMQRGIPIKLLKSQFGISGSTLSTWKQPKNAKKIFDALNDGRSGDVARVRDSKHPKLDRAFMSWFRKTNSAPTTPIMNTDLLVTAAQK